MLKLRMAALVLIAGFIVTPSYAQQGQAQAPAATEAQSPLIGLAVYTSDGEKIGQVTHVGLVGSEPAVRAELGGFLGLSPSLVVIPVSMFEQKPDRIELTMTAVEVKDTLSKQQQKP